MERNKKGRNDAATSRRPAAERSCEGDQLNPQLQDITESSAEQEESAWSLEDEIRIIDKLIAPYAKYKRASLRTRIWHYNEGVALVCSFPFSPEGNEHGRKGLAKLLRY